MVCTCWICHWTGYCSSCWDLNPLSSTRSSLSGNFPSFIEIQISYVSTCTGILFCFDHRFVNHLIDVLLFDYCFLVVQMLKLPNTEILWITVQCQDTTLPLVRSQFLCNRYPKVENAHNFNPCCKVL